MPGHWRVSGGQSQGQCRGAGVTGRLWLWRLWRLCEGDVRGGHGVGWEAVDEQHVGVRVERRQEAHPIDDHAGAEPGHVAAQLATIDTIDAR